MATARVLTTLITGEELYNWVKEKLAAEGLVPLPVGFPNLDIQATRLVLKYAATSPDELPEPFALPDIDLDLVDLPEDTPAVRVLRDVLRQLAATTYAPGHYVRGSLPPPIQAVLSKAVDLQPVVDDIQHHCTVCLLGGCLLSKARIMDAVPSRVIHFAGGDRYEANHTSTVAALSDVFTPLSLGLMESAFEVSSRYAANVDATPYELALAAAVFAADLPDARDRVDRVVRYAIRQGGQFSPDPLPRDQWDAANARVDEWRRKQTPPQGVTV